MRKFIISLVLILTTSLAFGQKYQGDLNFSIHLIGVGFSTSHGVSFNNNYLGVGVEAFETAVSNGYRNWYAVYADYRHLFNRGANGNSVFIQFAPGFSRSSNGSVLDKELNKGLKLEYKSCFYAKIGLGYQWNWTHTGLSIGTYCTYFNKGVGTTTKTLFPSIGVTFHW